MATLGRRRRSGTGPIHENDGRRIMYQIGNIKAYMDGGRRPSTSSTSGSDINLKYSDTDTYPNYAQTREHKINVHFLINTFQTLQKILRDYSRFYNYPHKRAEENKICFI